MFPSPYNVRDRRKPPPGTPGYFGAALANRLELAVIANEGAGGIVRDYGPRSLSLATNAANGFTPAAPPVWRAGPDGPCVDYGDGTAFSELSYIRKGSNQWATQGKPLTIMVCARCDDPNQPAVAGGPEVGAVRVLFNLGERSDSNVGMTFGLEASAGSGDLAFSGDGNPGGGARASNLVPLRNKWFVAGCAQASATSHNFFLDGVFQTNTTSSGTGTIGANQSINVGCGYANSLPLNGWYGLISWVLVWSRVLTNQEMRAVWRDPYWFMRPFRVSNSIMVPAAGGTTLVNWHRRLRGRAA